MSVHHATVDWRLEGDFLARRYSRAHTIAFDGGVTVAGTASPHVIPAPYSKADAVDPETAFTASLSACHMLWFLDLAGRAGFVVERYRDEAEGTLGKGPSGKFMMTRVALRPRIVFGGDKQPSPRELADLHHRAHEECFIANSVTTEVVVEASPPAR